MRDKVFLLIAVVSAVALLALDVNSTIATALIALTVFGVLGFIISAWRDRSSIKTR